MRVISTILGFIAAVIVVTVIGAGAHALINRGDLEAIGGNFENVSMLSWIGHDIVGMGPMYGMILGIALLLGFIVARLVLIAAPSLRPISYPLAGGAAVIAAILIMNAVYNTTPIASARAWDGLIAQAAAGLLAGLTFLVLQRPAR